VKLEGREEQFHKLISELNQFRNWFIHQAVIGRRIAVNIKMNNFNPEETEFRIWVYDADLQVGQFVKSIDEIDLEEELRKKEHEQYLELKKKFEPGED
jgi:hypothetical protein